jgi:hypothetical protein
MPRRVAGYRPRPPDRTGMIQNRVSRADLGVRTRPLLFAGAVLAIIVGFLGLDHFASLEQQAIIGGATWAALLAACIPLSAKGRARVAIVVVVATAAEILGSIVIGAYEYRLGNLPAFVPPGHGLVYLAGLRISQSAAVRRHRQAFLAAIVALVAAWGIAGLAVLGRADVLGALCAVLLIYVLVRGRAPTLYAGVFIMVALLELYGTAIGAWTWAEVVPGTPVSAGNPPSGIAGAYVLFDIAAIAFAPRLVSAFAAVGRLRPRFAG